MLIYRLDLFTPLDTVPLPLGRFIMAERIGDVFRQLSLWFRNWGCLETFRTALKVFSGKRIFFGVLIEGQIAQSAWANLGFCRHYPVENDSVVLGSVWTSPDFRGKGLATEALRHMIALLSKRGRSRFYVDT